jgi:hypothetical protein
MAMRKPSGVPVAIVLSYLEMTKAFATIQNISKLDDYLRNPDVPKVTYESEIGTYCKSYEYLIVFY